MKIIVYGLTPSRGGVEELLIGLMRSEQAKNHEITFFVEGMESVYSEEIEALGGTVVYVPKRRNNPIGNMLFYRNFFKKNRFDVAYFNLSSLFCIFAFTAAVRCGVCKIVAHAHTAEDKSAHNIHTFFHKRHRPFVNDHSDVKLAASNRAAEWVFGEKAIVVPNGIDVNRFVFSAENREKIRTEYRFENFVFGCVGRFCEQKNQAFLLDVFRELKDNSQYSLLLVGGGNDENLRFQVGYLNLKNVYFVSPKDVAPYYSAFDAFLFPSKYEGFGLAAIEAIANGLSVIASDTLPEEVLRAGHVMSLPLSVKKWAEELPKINGIGRFDCTDELIKHYDISTYCEKIFSYFQ